LVVLHRKAPEEEKTSKRVIFGPKNSNFRGFTAKKLFFSGTSQKKGDFSHFSDSPDAKTATLKK